ncbi:DUF6708 domain-containing protein [Shewanella sp. NIFS-20-20]|uniref:DUF6708 domain-containing protein n=1 Tax=Shewanella sp. NIFS-20-20 TaxID=2853806 RepID=UPI001C48584B|nr:DUF6708 domain-containing protein [Shewanella sp. NIFS-20-20]MBV7317616.1 hypothetical protein [Shewanella sp. NIFS-20-20]
MPNKITKVSKDLWIGAEEDGYTPSFINTIKRRGHGFSTGFGTSHIMEDVLNPPAKSIPMQDDAQYNVAFYLYSAGTHGDFIDMRVNSVHNRQTLTRAAQFLLLPMFLFLYFILRLGRDDVPWLYLGPVELGLVVCMLLMCFIDVCRPLRTPVRFHHKNQEVYVFHKKALYRIPWKECEIATMFAPHHVGYGAFSDAYNLNLWLYPQHCVNNQARSQPVALNLLMSVSGHSETYSYWEFVRRFMSEGPTGISFANQPQAFVYKIPHANWSLKARIIGWILAPVFYCLLPFISPSQFATRFNPIKDQWPDVVHQWSGKTVKQH